MTHTERERKRKMMKNSGFSNDEIREMEELEKIEQRDMADTLRKILDIKWEKMQMVLDGIEKSIKELKPMKPKPAATRHSVEKSKSRNIGFKEVYNTDGILSVLSYDADTGEILDVAQIPQLQPLEIWTDPLNPIYPYHPYPRPELDPDQHYPNWWEYQFTTGEPLFNMCGGSCSDENSIGDITTNMGHQSVDSGITSTYVYEFESAEDFITWLDSATVSCK
jgi:hypothetical protein